MDQTPIHDYVDLHGQTETAKRLGITQGAIWQMLNDKRKIFIVVGDDGGISYAYEQKPVGKFRAQDGEAAA